MPRHRSTTQPLWIFRRAAIQAGAIGLIGLAVYHAKPIAELDDA